MFTILGSDGKEYGPVTVEKIHEWVAGGRANLQTKIRRDGETEWKAVADFPELTFGNPAPAGAVPPPAVPYPPPSLTPPAKAGVELAGRGLRLGSFLLDCLFSSLCALPGLLMFGPAFFAAAIAASRNQQPDFAPLATVSVLIGCVLFFSLSLGFLILQIWMLSTRGQTVAKRILGLRVVRYPDATPAGFVHGWLLRNFVCGIIRFIPWIGFLFFLVDSCMIFTNERRCVHDMIAGTQVVKV